MVRLTHISPRSNRYLADPAVTSRSLGSYQTTAAPKLAPPPRRHANCASPPSSTATSLLSASSSGTSAWREGMGWTQSWQGRVTPPRHGEGVPGDGSGLPSRTRHSAPVARSGWAAVQTKSRPPKLLSVLSTRTAAEGEGSPKTRPPPSRQRRVTGGVPPSHRHRSITYSSPLVAAAVQEGPPAGTPAGWRGVRVGYRDAVPKHRRHPPQK